MDPTIDEISAARLALNAEITLLQRKVESGQTLRAGERRFLITIVDQANDEGQRISGAMTLLDALEKCLCSKCKAHHLAQWRRDLEKRWGEIR